ncbi:hypothetical protein BHE74_00059453 [Ensete ventricosum]|nr:hypothetical protein BHE74_00059453 [Ensete ventricosum]
MSQEHPQLNNPNERLGDILTAQYALKLREQLPFPFAKNEIPRLRPNRSHCRFPRPVSLASSPADRIDSASQLVHVNFKSRLFPLVRSLSIISTKPFS